MSNKKNALIIGASGGIGRGLIEQLLDSPEINLIVATYRRQEKAQDLFKLESLFPDQLILLQVDVTSEESIQQAVSIIQSKIAQLHLAINCVGMLHEDNLQPEKSLKHINSDNLLRYFEVNTIPTALLSKYLFPLFKHPEFSVWATISAKVGSIGDNGLGGWYGYRASKAALNMIIKNVAIEFARSSKNTVVVALHPGTTDTQLSLPFQKNVPPEKLFSPQLCAQQLLSVINNLTRDNNGQFFSWDGSVLPW
jgi:NAD(P)-dependent dehydrogenase (short-subunit alcohol dehydrogenase family)